MPSEFRRRFLQGLSGKYHFRRAQPLDVDSHLIPPRNPLGGHHAAGEHDVATAQADAVGSELIGQPGERSERVTQNVTAQAPSAFLAVNGHGSRQCSQIEYAPLRLGGSQHNARLEEVVG